MRMVESLIFMPSPFPCSLLLLLYSPLALLLYYQNKEGSYFSYLWTYDFSGPVCAFDAGKSIMRASERGLGPGNRDFFGPCEMTLSRQASAIWAEKRLPGPNLLPHAQLMDLPAS